jgi:Fe-S-cluster containining protein
MRRIDKKKQNKNFIPKTKNATPNRTLKQKLNDIYYGTINLDTTCKGNSTCCKVGCPQMNFAEYTQLINEIWSTASKTEKIELICKSVEYFFHNEFSKWGMESLLKPCMLLTKEGKCSQYKSRCLNCRIFGLWPDDLYNERVDHFEEAYEGLLKRDELPLNKQCPHVKRVDDSKPLTEDIINGLFKQLDDLDGNIGNFTSLQIEQKDNYRTLHDWILLSIFGEQWLVNLTQFVLSANKDAMVDLIEQIKKSARENFAKNMPNIKLVK